MFAYLIYGAIVSIDNRRVPSVYLTRTFLYRVTQVGITQMVFINVAAKHGHKHLEFISSHTLQNK